MTPEHIAPIAREVQTLYSLGPSSAWSKATDPHSHEARSIASLFAGYMPDRILTALRSYASDEPKTPPKPAELRARIRAEAVHKAKRRDPENCRHPAPYAIWGDDEDGNRLADCLQCYSTLVFKPGEVLTESEIEARQQAAVRGGEE